MKANSDVTDALRRTIARMQSELERSVLTTQMLETSTASLRSTSLQHDTLSSVMITSRQLITALEKADWLDRILILSGFFFFILVVLFILKQRIVDRGLRVAFWWTRFLPDLSADKALLEQGSLRAAGDASVLAATMASSMSVLPSAVVSPHSSASMLQVLNPNSIPAATFSRSEPIPSLSFIPEHVENPTPCPEPAEVTDHEEL